MSNYNSVAAALLVPFDDSDISSRLQNPNKDFHEKYNPRFSYVTPEKYRRRIMEVFKYGYKFGIIPSSVQFIEDTGIFAVYEFKGEVADEGVAYDLTAPVFEPFAFAYDAEKHAPTTKKINMDKMQNSMTSSALKALALNMGVGLDLYNKIANGAGPAASTSASPASSNSSSQAPAPAASTNVSADGWNGSATINYGKHKGTTYATLEDSYVGYMSTKVKDDNVTPFDINMLKESARRKGAVASTAETNAAESSDDDAEFPF